jgi:proline dehydrogenase
MPLMRTAMLRAARSPRLRTTAERSVVVRPVVTQFVAGTTQSDALTAATELADSGLFVTLDYLGEDSTSREQGEANVAAYVSLFAALDEAGLASRAEASLKLSAIGQALPGDGEAIATDAAHRICEAAAAVGTTITLDMEDHTTTDSTLRTLATLRREHAWVGVALQAQLKRTVGDCRDLATPNSRIRLCKGAYAAPTDVAYRGHDVDESYRRCLDILLNGDGYPMIATHDPKMIDYARTAIQARQRTADTYEYQMLYGVRRNEQRKLAATGRRMRVYLPYGQQWYGYFMRRLAERPANLRFFFRAAVQH